MNAICVVTEDQPLDPLMGTTPTCFYEAQFGFCRPYFALPDDVKGKFVPAGSVIDVEPIIAKHEREQEQGGGLRRTQQVRRAQVFEYDDAKDSSFEEQADDKTLVQAVRVTKEIYESNPELMKIICLQLFCYIPTSWRTRTGGFTAHGTGNQDLKIIGGTGDLFGAFGQVRRIFD